MFFTGQAKTRKIDLRGASKAPESREQVLERLKLEREQRKRSKLEEQSATTIQAAWRGRTDAARHRAAVRAAWMQQYGPAAEGLISCSLQSSNNCLRGFLYFVDLRRDEDVSILAAMCRAMVAAMSSSPGALFTTNGSDAGGSIQEHRLRRLVLLSLRAVAHNRWLFRSTLTGPKPGSGEQANQPAAAMIDFIIRAVTPDSWSAALGASPAAKLSSALVSHLRSHGLFAALQQLLEVLVAAGRPPKTYLETLVTQLCVRALAVAALGGSSSTIGSSTIGSSSGVGSSSGGAYGGAGVSERRPLPDGMHLLLCTPLLWSCCPSLRPVAGRMCREALLQLGAATSLSTALSSLPSSPTTPGGTAGAVAAMLGNLLETGPMLLPADRSSAVALQACNVLASMLELLPNQLLFPSREVEDAAGDASVPSTSGRRNTLTWPSEDMVPAELLQQLQLISGAPGRQLLQQLVEALLPVKSPTAGAAAAPTAHVYGLCRLLRRALNLPVHRQQLLLGLAVGADLVQRLWLNYLRFQQQQQQQQQVSAPSSQTPPSGIPPDLQDPGWLLPLTLCCAAFSSYLATADLDDFYVRERPLPMRELYDAAAGNIGFVPFLRSGMWQVLWNEADKPPPAGSPAAALRAEFADAGGRLLAQLYDLNSSRPFCPTEAFHAPQLVPERFQAEVVAVAARERAGAHGSSGGGSSSAGGSRSDMLGGSDARVWTVLRYAPCIIPFQERAQVFQREVARDRTAAREQELSALAERGMLYQEQRFYTIRRDMLLEDAFVHLNKPGESLKGRVRIRFINEHGAEEAGVDGGGLFKDFMERVLQEGFTPDFGLFATTAANQLYPNPAALSMHGQQQGAALLVFLGRMLGKSMYEGILSELPMAAFFLKKWRGALCDINDMPSLEPQVYKSLMQLRNYPGDVSDLCLTFTVVDEQQLGTAREVELRPGGRDIAVTRDNVIEYIHRVADYRLNQQMGRAVRAFLSGFFELIRPEWVRMFATHELQMLISGSDERVDLDDLAAHMQYAGGYHEEHPVIANFWTVLRGFSLEQQRDFLRFVTSCSRGPLLGFGYLEPRMCVQMAGGVLEAESKERLPTSATCMNLLKLPPYSSVETMRQKLLYAISQSSGFDLS